MDLIWIVNLNYSFEVFCQRDFFRRKIYDFLENCGIRYAGKSHYILKWEQIRLSPHDKVLGKCFEALLSHVCIRSTEIPEKPSTARANMTAISISVYDIGPRQCAPDLTSTICAISLFYMDIILRLRVFSASQTYLSRRFVRIFLSVIYFY